MARSNSGVIQPHLFEPERWFCTAKHIFCRSFKRRTEPAIEQRQHITTVSWALTQMWCVQGPSSSLLAAFCVPCVRGNVCQQTVEKQALSPPDGALSTLRPFSKLGCSSKIAHSILTFVYSRAFLSSFRYKISIYCDHRMWGMVLCGPEDLKQEWPLVKIMLQSRRLKSDQ